MCRISPAIKGRRRPNASEIGPMISWPRPSPSRVPVSVSWTAVELVCRPEAIEGSAGRYMSIVNGPIAINDPRTVTNAARCRPLINSPGKGCTTGSISTTVELIYRVKSQSGIFIPRDPLDVAAPTLPST
jgi:hypothetical protein